LYAATARATNRTIRKTSPSCLLSHSPTTNRYKRPRREAVEGLRSRLDGTVGAYDYDEDEDEDEGEKAEDEKEGRERGVGKECEEVTKEIPGTLGYK